VPHVDSGPEIPAGGGVGGDNYLLSTRFDEAQAYAPPYDGSGVAVAVVEGGRVTDTTLATGVFDGILDLTKGDIYCLPGPQGGHTDAVSANVAGHAGSGLQDPPARTTIDPQDQ